MNDFIRLPQLKIFSDAPPTRPSSTQPSSTERSSERLLLITGGRPPTLDWLLDCATTFERIWCIDHGIDVCRQAGLVPEILIGDLDSARSDSIDWARSLNVPIERHPVDKDFTDTQLALARAARLDQNISVVITGAFGGRLDHLFATLMTCAHSRLRIFLADHSEIIIFLRADDSIRLEFDRIPTALSLLPITDICRGVSIDGVHWILDDADLSSRLPNAVSNRVESNVVHLSLQDGVLAVHMFFDRQRQERSQFYRI